MSEIDGLTTEEKRALLKDLKEALFTGALRVRFRERDVTYRSLGEMRAIIQDIEQEIAPRKRRNVIMTTFNRGR